MLVFSLTILSLSLCGSHSSHIPGDCNKAEWLAVPGFTFVDLDNHDIGFEFLGMEDLPEGYTTLTSEVCKMMCMNYTAFECRFYSPVDDQFCLLVEHTNHWEFSNGYQFYFYERPRQCLENDGCTEIGEYYAHSRSRCHFYQCAPGDGGHGHQLRAIQHRCPTSTVTRSDFISSRNDPHFTQPCSSLGFKCEREFPLFAP